MATKYLRLAAILNLNSQPPPMPLIFLIHFCNSPHSILEKAASLLVSLMLGNCGALSGAGALVLFSAISTEGKLS